MRRELRNISNGDDDYLPQLLHTSYNALATQNKSKAQKFTDKINRQNKNRKEYFRGRKANRLRNATGGKKTQENQVADQSKNKMKTPAPDYCPDIAHSERLNLAVPWGSRFSFSESRLS